MPDTKDALIQGNRAEELASVLTESFRALALRHERLTTLTKTTVDLAAATEASGIAQIVEDVMHLRFSDAATEWFSDAT